MQSVVMFSIINFISSNMTMLKFYRLSCFIQSINDDLVNDGGIMDLWVREARLFKYGSGTGTNFSNLRGENEPGTFYLNHTYKTYLTKPYLGSFIFLIQNSQLINGINRLSRRFEKFNSEEHYDNINIYLEAKKNISLISQSYNAYHISILQPYLGFKKNKLSKF